MRRESDSFQVALCHFSKFSNLFQGLILNRAKYVTEGVRKLLTFWMSEELFELPECHNSIAWAAGKQQLEICAYVAGESVAQVHCSILGTLHWKKKYCCMLIFYYCWERSIILALWQRSLKFIISLSTEKEALHNLTPGFINYYTLPLVSVYYCMTRRCLQCWQGACIMIFS